jgi:O-antigen/teichoic acid export membrane protein
VAECGGTSLRAQIVTATGEHSDARGDRLVHSTLALLTTNATGAVLGIAFWAVAARQFTAPAVGRGVAEIAAMTFLANVAMLNLGTVFPRFLYPSGASAGRVLRAGYGASIGVAVIASAVFLVVAGHRDYIGPGTIDSLYFLGAVVLWVIFSIEDAALIGLRATSVVPIENTAFSILKVALLPVFAVVAPKTGVFAAWMLPVLACIVPVNLYIFRRVLPEHVRRSEGHVVLPTRRVLGSVVLGEYVGGLAFTSMNALPALIVAVRLGSAQAAYFQTPWLAGTSFDMLLFSFATSLLVESSARPEAASATVRRAVRFAVTLLAPCLVILVVGAPWLLRILGSAYATHGTRLLQLVALGLPFMGVNVLYVTFARLSRRVRRVVTLQVSLATIVLTLTVVLLAPLGITGAGVAFVSGQALCAAAVLPSVIRQYRMVGMSPSFSSGATLVAGHVSGEERSREDDEQVEST